MKQTLAMVREFRTGNDSTPIILMGYFNPVYAYGIDRFCKDASDAGVDGLGSVKSVAFNGTSVDVPATGSISVTGQYGVLTIQADGTYSYLANKDNPDGVDTFTYVMSDNDGDLSTAELNITVTSIDDVPVVSVEGKTVDDTDLANGDNVVNGKVVVKSTSRYYVQRQLDGQKLAFRDAPAPVESEFGINQRFSFVEQMVDMIVQKTLPSAVITGEGGLGKSYTVLKSLEKNGFKNLTDLSNFEVGAKVDRSKSYTVVTFTNFIGLS